MDPEQKIVWRSRSSISSVSKRFADSDVRSLVRIVFYIACNKQFDDISVMYHFIKDYCVTIVNNRKPNKNTNETTSTHDGLIDNNMGQIVRLL